MKSCIMMKKPAKVDLHSIVNSIYSIESTLYFEGHIGINYQGKYLKIFKDKNNELEAVFTLDLNYLIE